MSELVVGALIVDSQDRVFLQQRAADRELFPGCWDVVGGHVEAHESPLAALRREIAEETGWRLDRVLRQVAEGTWEAGGVVRTEVDYVVEVAGDLTAPRLEWHKHPRYAWFGPADLPPLDDSVRRSGSAFIRDAVRAAHDWLARTPAHHRKDISDSM
ncbi:NUDIX domain-containing protein [Streptomyces sp. NPDC052042]|uniref:NUDIX domain-containing protein n=1 Tax=Streptomyces sp. NPDC052042 TaxID=3365683 RepID=UPI0037D3F286